MNSYLSDDEEIIYTNDDLEINQELELTEAILNGHKAKDNDKFAKTRAKLKKLRDELSKERPSLKNLQF